MSDNADQTLKILIQFGIVNEADAERAKQVLSDAKDKTKDLGRSEEEGAEHASLFHKNHRLIHQVLHLIAHESGPAMGAALSAAGAAAGGGLLFGVMAAKELFEWLHQLKEAANEFKARMEEQIDLARALRCSVNL